MPTPPKPHLVLLNEKKSHRTKAELDLRAKKEKELQTGTEMKERPEVRKNKAAHKEFLRIKKLLFAIEKNDALFEPVINRYAMIQAECMEFEEKRETFYDSIAKLEKEYDEAEGEDKMSMYDFYKLLGNMQSNVLAIDKQIQAKRKMLLDIEKECIMTIAAALRSIPKAPEDVTKDDPMASVLGRRRG